MDIYSNVLNMRGTGRTTNALDATNPQDYVTKAQFEARYSAANITASATVADQSFILTSGTNVITLTIPATRTLPLIIKHTGTQDLTIVRTGGQIDGNANLVLRGGKKNAVELHFLGANAWIV